MKIPEIMETVENRISEAIDSIVGYKTLPSQIDHVKPYALEAEKAQEFINSLPTPIKVQAEGEIKKQVEAYYESEVPYLDSLF